MIGEGKWSYIYNELRGAFTMKDLISGKEIEDGSVVTYKEHAGAIHTKGILWKGSFYTTPSNWVNSIEKISMGRLDGWLCVKYNNQSLAFYRTRFLIAYMKAMYPDLPPPALLSTYQVK